MHIKLKELNLSSYLEVIRHFVSEFARPDDRSLGNVWARGSEKDIQSPQPGLFRKSTELSKLIALEKDQFQLFGTRSTEKSVQLLSSKLGIANNKANKLHNRDLQTFNLMCIMQHHRARTRLLDWSGNPLIALFFAIQRFVCNPESKEEFSPCVYLINPKLVNQHAFAKLRCSITPSSDKFYRIFTGNDEELRKRAAETDDASECGDTIMPIAVMPSQVTTRITAQQGRFTFHSLHEGEQSIDKSFSFTKIVLPSNRNSLRDLYLELRSIGITEFTVFPDLDGLGLYSTQIYNEFNDR